MSDMVTILTSGGFATVVTSALGFVFRGWISDHLRKSIEHEYDRKLEIHKAKLRSETDAEIARLKSDLEIAAAARNVRYSRTFEQTAKVIATTYGLLLKLKDAADNLGVPLASPDEQKWFELVKEVYNRAEEFTNYYRPNKIYIPKTTAEKIEELSNMLQGFVRTAAMIRVTEKADVKNIATMEKMYKRFDERSEKIPALLSTLEEEFQKILGFLDGEPRSSK